MSTNSSIRKVRFSDEVYRISSYSVASSFDTSTSDDSSLDHGAVNELLRHSSDDCIPDRSSLSLDEKISFFNHVIASESQQSLNQIALNKPKGNQRMRRAYLSSSGSLKEKVLMFENLSGNGQLLVGTFPRSEMYKGETRAKINFFETLEKCNRAKH